MNYIITYNAPGRIRVRCGANAFTKSEGYGIAEFLKNDSKITAVTTCDINGSILIHHEHETADPVFTWLNQLTKNDLPPSPPNELQVMAETDRKYGSLFLKTIVLRYLYRAFLPPLLGKALTLFRAASYFKNGLDSLSKGRVDVAVLDASAIGASLIQRNYGTANSIMFLLSISELLEDYTKERAKISLAQSLKVHVDSVWIVHDDHEELVPISTLKIGDTIAVRTGSMIPIDGEVVHGECTINEASMTGESIPVEKYEGSSVYAGTVIEEGAIRIRVRALSDDTRINKIVDFIESSEKSKANLQSHAEQLADRIVPYSFLTSALVYLFTRNLTKALSVLMVDYSCAIKLSTPISVISAIKEASGRKIMVKGGRYLEVLSQADTVVFDKTGTLTTASPTVCKIVPFNGYSREEVLKIAACIEEHFPHSVARAIVKQAEIEHIDHREEHAQVEYVVAHGISTVLHGERAIIGSAHFIFEDEGVPLIDEDKQILDELSDSYSCIYLAIGNKLCGCLCIEDPPREESKEVIRQLKKLGIGDIIMLTGDSDKAARSVANQLGIDRYQSQVLPDEKADILAKLKAEGKTIIMVGDGINDSPALSVADVSIAMRDASDIAREVADVTLLSSDLNHLIPLIHLSRKLLVRIQRNYLFITTFNSGLLMLGLAGIITPTTSALLHNLSTMGISLHSTRPLLPSSTEESLS